jgi:hypothetical protein
MQADAQSVWQGRMGARVSLRSGEDLQGREFVLLFHATSARVILKVILALLCLTLALMQTFALNRVGKMDPLELPLWFSTSRVPGFFLFGLAILFWPIFVSGIIWTFLVLQWWIALIIIAFSGFWLMQSKTKCRRCLLSC